MWKKIRTFAVPKQNTYRENCEGANFSKKICRLRKKVLSLQKQLEQTIMSNKFNLQMPLFAGFYETIFDSRYAYDAQYDIDAFKENFGKEITEDDIDFDEKGYRAEIASAFCRQIERYLKVCGIVKSISDESAEVVSPAFYNFENDRVYADVEFAEGWEDKLKDFIASHWNELQDTIATEHSNRSGFVSFFSNDLDKWVELTFSENPKREAYLAALIQYYLIFDKDFDIEHIEYCVLEDVSPYEFAMVKVLP